MGRRNGKLPEIYRTAARIYEGYEICGRDGIWRTVVSELYIVAPLGVVLFKYTDGTESSHSPKAQLLSRRPARLETGDGQ